jgi:monothiol glutaredoxin
VHAVFSAPTTSCAYLLHICPAGQGMAPQLKSAIDNLIESNKIVVFMKGTKQFPQCGFSNTVVQVSSTCNACRYLEL